MYEQSHRDYLTLWLSASSSACHGLLIITVITPLPISPARQKCQRTEAGERGNYWHADASAWCCFALDANTPKELADAKLKMMLCVMMLPLVVVGCTSKQSVSRCVKPPPLGVDNAASPTGRHAERDYFTLRERLITMQKQLKEPRSILMSSADNCPYRWATHINYY